MDKESSLNFDSAIIQAKMMLTWTAVRKINSEVVRSIETRDILQKDSKICKEQDSRYNNNNNKKANTA